MFSSSLILRKRDQRNPFAMSPGEGVFFIGRYPVLGAPPANVTFSPERGPGDHRWSYPGLFQWVQICQESADLSAPTWAQSGTQLG